ncbi:MAG TPA: transcription termination factor Rho [Byssovorax sp.]|jgi:transcription termination factor Rho
MNLRELKQKPMMELAALAKSEGVEGARKVDLVLALLKAFAAKGQPISADGVFDAAAEGFGFLRAEETAFLPAPDDVYVPPSQVRKLGLRAGDVVSGAIRPPKEREAYFSLVRAESVNGAPPDGAERPRFDDFAPRYPDVAFKLEHGATTLSTRILDLLCPIGKGQRCLVVSPPRAGKSVLLREIAGAIAANHPEAHVSVVLVDERPEAVTEMRRGFPGEVLASMFDEAPARHVQLAELALERAKRLVELGNDAVVLLDSITRLTRAYNALSPHGGRGTAGVVDPGALQKGKRYLGAARAVEGGGSLTLITTALVDTGSRMDDVIFDDVKGAGNSEIHLDRRLMERRVFPSFDLNKTATRKEEALLPERVLLRARLLRSLLQPLSAVESMEFLLEKLAGTADNDDFLARMNS